MIGYRKGQAGLKFCASRKGQLLLPVVSLVTGMRIERSSEAAPLRLVA